MLRAHGAVEHAWCANRWFQLQWTDDILGKHISLKELILIIVATLVWGELNEVKKSGVMFLIHCNVTFENSIIYCNFGSLYIFNGNLTYNGYTKFENCAKPSHKSASDVDFISQGGGAITSFQLNGSFAGVSSLLNNQ